MKSKLKILFIAAILIIFSVITLIIGGEFSKIIHSIYLSSAFLIIALSMVIDSKMECIKNMNLINIDEDNPDFINEDGVKWWLINGTTDYAQRPNIKGTSLKNIQCYLTEFKDGSKIYVLLDINVHQVIFNSSQLEAMVCYIDMLKINKEK